MHQVRVGLEDELRAGPRLQRDAGLVRLGSRRKEQRVLLAEELRHAPLEQARGRVPIEHVVAHHGLGDGAAHGGGRLGDRVRAQVDDRHPSWTRWLRRMRTRS